jgi:pimeloyl-ACP methyl ester carboxylesterase
VRVASTDGVELVLHDFGGDGPLLIISHATGLCAGAYRPLGDLLARHFSVWALDYRGHGDSSVPETGSQAWRGMGDDLLACIDALEGGPVFLAGHSMGGAAAFMAAARSDRVRAMYVFEPVVPLAPGALGGSQGSNNFMAVAARRRRATFPGKAEALLRYAGRPPLGWLRADSLAAYVDSGFAEQPDGTVTLKCTPEIEAQTFESAGELSADQLTELRVPTMVACGALEKEITPGQFAAGIAAALPLAQLVEYPHLGHFGPLQDPVTVANDIVAFADRHRH